MTAYDHSIARTTDTRPIQCEIYSYATHDIPKDQIIAALRESAEECYVEEVHRSQIDLSFLKSCSIAHYTNRFHRSDGSPINVRLHLYVQPGQPNSQRSIKGFIEHLSEDSDSTPAVSAPAIDFSLEQRIGAKNARLQLLDAELQRERSQRLQAEEHLHALKTHYAALVERLPVITYIAPFQPGCAPITISPQIETLIGFPLSDWLHTPDFWQQQIHPDDRDYVQLERLHCYETEQPFCCEYRMLTSDGREVWVHEEAIPLTTDSEAPCYIQGVLLDITRRREAAAYSLPGDNRCSHAASQGALV